MLNRAGQTLSRWATVNAGLSDTGRVPPLAQSVDGRRSLNVAFRPTVGLVSLTPHQGSSVELVGAYALAVIPFFGVLSQSSLTHPPLLGGPPFSTSFFPDPFFFLLPFLLPFFPDFFLPILITTSDRLLHPRRLAEKRTDLTRILPIPDVFLDLLFGFCLPLSGNRESAHHGCDAGGNRGHCGVPCAVRVHG
jgi:hypothetical protein